MSHKTFTTRDTHQSFYLPSQISTFLYLDTIFISRKQMCCCFHFFLRSANCSFSSLITSAKEFQVYFKERFVIYHVANINHRRNFFAFSRTPAPSLNSVLRSFSTIKSTRNAVCLFSKYEHYHWTSISRLTYRRHTRLHTLCPSNQISFIIVNS